MTAPALPARTRPWHVMSPPEGAAIRVQLDAMLAALAPFDQKSVVAHDTPVARLLGSLYTAAQAAGEIERRTYVPEPRKGVVFTKR